MLLPLRMWAVASSAEDSSQVCRIVKLDVERLPDLNVPRAGHQVFYANGELTVAGGHTDGFVPTPTLEYYQDGVWHTLQTTYTHDVGTALVLKSGKVLLAGGCEQPTGIGQTYTAELYDPTTHTFRGFGNMCQKRVYASALELDSGQVIIAGNWYHDDGIELFQEAKSAKGDNLYKQSFTCIKDVTIGRANPSIFRIADDDVLIFSVCTLKGDIVSTTSADRLKGDSVHIPLFETWQPLPNIIHDNTAGFIGDETKGDYTYLLPVKDSTGQIAIARVCGLDFTLLPTACAVPMQCQGDEIEYLNVIVDRHIGRAYLYGISSSHHTIPDQARFYVLSIDYLDTSGTGAPLTLYYTDTQSFVPDHSPLLTPEGNLLLVGGLTDCSNFNPSKSVILLCVREKTVDGQAGISFWLVGLLILAALLLAVTYIYLNIYKKRHHVQSEGSLAQTDDAAKLLLERINKVMDEQKLYQNSELKLQDVAAALGTNRRFVSDCINSQTGSSFAQYVNAYRIDYAKRVLRHNPDKKITDVYHESGFANESTFFRTFKSVMGMTPKEWLSKL